MHVVYTYHWNSSCVVIELLAWLLTCWCVVSKLLCGYKSLRHVAMVAKCLDDNKPKIHLKSEFALFQNFKTSKFHLICHMLAKFSGFNSKGPYPTLEKEKETICVVFTYSVKRAREIRKFHVAVVQRRLRNVQKKREETSKVVVLLI